MQLLIYFFNRPVHYFLIAAAAVFIGLYLLARSRESLSRIVFAGLVLELCVVTLHFSGWFKFIGITKTFVFEFVPLTLFLLWISHAFDRETHRLTSGPLNIAVFSFFVICVLGAFLAPRRFWYYAFDWAVRFASAVLLFFLVIQFVNTRRRWTIILHTFLALLGVTSIYCILQMQGLGFEQFGGRIVNVSSFGNKNVFASFLCFTTPLALSMAAGARTAPRAAGYGTLAALGLYNIWVGETRGAWLGMMAFGALAVLFECRYGRLRMWAGTIIKAALLVAAVAVGAVILLSVISEHRLDTLRSIFQTTSGTNIIRVYMWWAAARMLWDNPLFGQGLGTSHVVFPFFRPDQYNRIGMQHNTDFVHSEALQVLCEQGIIGFSAWLAVLIIFFMLALRKLRALADSADRYILFGLTGALFGALVHESISFNLRWASSMMAFWFEMAMATRYVMGFEETAERRRGVLAELRMQISPRTLAAGRMAVLPVLGAAFVFMSYGHYRVLRGDWALKEMRVASRAVSMGEESVKSNPYNHSAYDNLAIHYFEVKDIPKALEWSYKVMQIAPNYGLVQRNVGLAYYDLYSRTNSPLQLYAAAIEFEAATLHNNDIDNNDRLVKLYALHMNNESRARYHSRLMFSQAVEDWMYNHHRMAATYGWNVHHLNLSNLPPDFDHHRYLFEIFIKPGNDAIRAYWQKRLDLLHQHRRPRDEIRYTLRMAAGYVPDNQALVEMSIREYMELEEPEIDLAFLANYIESLRPGHGPAELLHQTRLRLIELGGPQASPWIMYAIGVISHQLGDHDAAQRFMSMARARGAQFKQFNPWAGRLADSPAGRLHQSRTP
ncbi:MAG: hypothetical protein A3G34_11645 [Candidatus Lindowbacteria bacterium RIFCSPLOWO2_12_FULL_62_27]|nr:MAG: hypothetical protein A3G34_11645 [Candidatus Lindowbacteria bacterium RIFCSPLOWO2_12_FULL_62_27]OGH61180.1 MAG: hypothetical protein A3I06_04775 [Candidatus Lindowbacteria bacterium RIFCSPLOWO2_02_FULL_62_12]